MDYEWTFLQKIYNNFFKVILDYLGAIVFLVVFFWIFIICAILIAIEDGFPVVYKQVRVGKGHKNFFCFKFRSMVKNADKIGPTSTASNDARITRVGRILRKTSLDELPQIFNILKGEMSFIGFRPDVPRDEELPTIKYAVKPGITGLAQVNGRSNISTEDREFYQNEYVRKISILLDIKILFKTFAVVLGHKGTN